MLFIETYGKEIISLLVPFIAWVLNSFFKGRANLEFSSPHQFTFLIQEPLLDRNGNQISPTQTLRTRSITVANSGKEPATNVEIVFNWKPPCLNLWPVRHFSEHTESDNRYVLIFDSLAPGEAQGCEILSLNAELPEVITVRSKECVAKSIPMYPQPVISNSKKAVAAIFMFFGLATTVYLTIVLIQFLVLKTPLGH